MLLDVYAQLQQRVNRDHGHAFDSVVRHARNHLATPSDEQAEVAEADDDLRPVLVKHAALAAA